MKIRLKDIIQGKTYVWSLEFYEDEAMQTPLDVSGHSFAFIAENASGTNIITLANAAFVESASNVRVVTLSAVTTAGYAAAVLNYELEVTLPDLTVERWMYGTITVKSEIV
jgi:FtsP/CotA-like multicopper oxidase with cupredoxin domain